MSEQISRMYAELASTDRFNILKSINEFSNVSNRKKLNIYPDKFPLYGDQECLIELDELLPVCTMNEEAPNYTGLVYSQTNKKMIQFNLIDSFNTEIQCNRLLISGIIPSNQYEESCVLFVFKTLTDHNHHHHHNNHLDINNKLFKRDLEADNKSTTGSLGSTTKSHRTLEEETFYLNNSYLVGYAQFNYFKDSYFVLCEYLFHSVYDSSSLDNFELNGYLCSNEQNYENILFQNLEDIRLNTDNSTANFILYYFKYNQAYKKRYNSLNSKRNKLKYLDSVLAKSYKIISLPSDWTLLGQHCYLNKVIEQPRENLFHLCARHNLIKFCRILFKLPASEFALKATNKQSESPYNLAMKNKFDQLAELMFEHLKWSSSLSINTRHNDLSSTNSSAVSTPSYNNQIQQQQQHHQYQQFQQQLQQNPKRIMSTSSSVSSTSTNDSKLSIKSSTSSSTSTSTLPVQLPLRHNHTHLSILDIRHFSSHLSSSSPNDLAISSNSNTNINTSTSSTTTPNPSTENRPIHTEDVIIIDDDDNHVILPIKNQYKPDMTQQSIRRNQQVSFTKNQYKKKKKSKNPRRSLRVNDTCKLSILNDNYYDKIDDDNNDDDEDETSEFNNNNKHELLDELDRDEEEHLDNQDDDSEDDNDDGDDDDDDDEEDDNEVTLDDYSAKKSGEHEDDYEEEASLLILNESRLSSSSSSTTTTTTTSRSTRKKSNLKSSSSSASSSTTASSSSSSSSSNQHNNSRKSITSQKLSQNKFNKNTDGSNKQFALLPPLPRSSQPSLSHSMSTSTIQQSSTNNNNNNNTLTTSDFDRNLHVRRSKRFIRQLATNTIVLQEINISNVPVTCQISDTNLTKTLSTPSIVEHQEITEEKSKNRKSILVNCESTCLSNGSSLNTTTPTTNTSFTNNNNNNNNNNNSTTNAKPFIKYSKRCDSCVTSTKIDNLRNSFEKEEPELNGQTVKELNNSNELVTINEFLREFEQDQKASSQPERPQEQSIKESTSGMILEDPITPLPYSYDDQHHSTPLRSSILGHSKSTSDNNSNNSASSQVVNTSTNTSQNSSISKSKKLGQILKLASVRGAKSKSMKHKYSQQQNSQQQHAYKSLITDVHCHICQKSLLNKKALHCKNCFLIVHENLCKDSIPTCINYKSLTSSSPQSSIFSSSLTVSQHDKLLEEDNSVTISSTTSSCSTSRPKSMDITKYFQAHLSKSTSNMYSESVDSLAYKLEDSCSLMSTQFKTNLAELNKEFGMFETEFSATNWADMQTPAFLDTLNKHTRNKQENIFEFMKTEVNYVKILNIAQKIYVNVMQNECKIEDKYIKQMFPDLDRLIYLHKSLLDRLIDRYNKSTNKYISTIGDILYDVLSVQCDNIIEIYSKVCCMHLSAKSLYKQFSINNKSFINLLQECRKHHMLRRYQIPDCLTIITQRLTKYLTLIENMISNSKEEKNNSTISNTITTSTNSTTNNNNNNNSDHDLLNKSLDKLRFILTRVNDAVAFHQNSNEFKRILDNIDVKSYTYCLDKVDKQIEQRKFTKADLFDKADRKVLSLNNVVVKCMSKNGKVYKDVTCLTMTDMIVFLQLNDKNKYVFMNDNSVIPCTNGILIRPKVNEITPSRQSSSLNSQLTSSVTNNFFSSSTLNLNMLTQNPLYTLSASHSTNLNLNNNSHHNSNSNSSSSLSTLPAYIVNTITNEIIEIKFSDEISRNQWLTLVHMHITRFIEENTTKEDSTSQIETFMNTNNQSYSNMKSKSLKISNSDGNPTSKYRYNSKSSSVSSGQGSSFKSSCSSSSSTSGKLSSAVTSSSLITSNTLESALNISDSAINTQSSTMASSSANCENISLNSCDMQLTPDLANILCSFNNLIEQSIFQGNLMRSASSAGETITKSSQDLHVSMPKRAETFNGATAKESQLSSVNINCDLIKSKVYKNSCILNYENSKANSCSSSGTSGSYQSTDSGYQSRLCADHHDIDCDANCSFSELKTKLSSSNGASISKTQFESILKCVLNDYMRLKNENESLRKELESKNKSIEVLKSTMQECKDQMNTEKEDYIHNKYSEKIQKEDRAVTSTTSISTNMSNVKSIKKQSRTTSASQKILFI